MKQHSKFILLVFLTVLIVLGTYTSGQAVYLNKITGCLYKSLNVSTPEAWTYGSTVTLYDVSNGTKSQLTQVSTNNLTTCFTLNFSAASSPRTLMVEVDYTDAGKGDPDTDIMVILDDNSAATADYDTGDWSANTSPTAVTLSQLEASSAASPWVLFAILGTAVGLAGGAFTIVRRRKAA